MTTTTLTKTSSYDVFVSFTWLFLYDNASSVYPKQELEGDYYLSSVELHSDGDVLASKDFAPPTNPIPSEWKELGGVVKTTTLTDHYELELESAPDLSDIKPFEGRIVLGGQTIWADETVEEVGDWADHRVFEL